MNDDILVIHQGALGDVVLSFPALACLKQQRCARLTLLCKNQVGKIASEFNVVDLHLPIEGARFCGLFSKDMSRDIKDFIGHYETIILCGFSDDAANNIRQRHRGKTFRITARPPAQEQTHVAVHIARQMRGKGLLSSSEEIASRAWQHAEWRLAPGKLFLIHPGAGSRRKRWPLHHFLQVARAMNGLNSTRVVFLIGPAESDLLPLVRKKVEGQFQVQELKDLSEAAAIMKTSACFVGNDSGLTHLAAFLGVPAVAVFGPSSPERWSPIGPAIKALRGEGETECAPCFEIAKTNCDDARCLRGVSPEMVIEAVEDLVRFDGTY
jgi:ADP-heptose:LPS heptosyltransferase